MNRTDEKTIKVKADRPARLTFGKHFAEVHARVVRDAGGRSAVVGLDVPGDSGLAPVLFLMGRETRDPAGEPTSEWAYSVGACQLGDVRACLTVGEDGAIALHMKVDGTPRTIGLDELAGLVRQFDEAERVAVEVAAAQAEPAGVEASDRPEV